MNGPLKATRGGNDTFETRMGGRDHLAVATISMRLHGRSSAGPLKGHHTGPSTSRRHTRPQCRQSEDPRFQTSARKLLLKGATWPGVPPLRPGDQGPAQSLSLGPGSRRPRQVTRPLSGARPHGQTPLGQASILALSLFSFSYPDCAPGTPALQCPAVHTALSLLPGSILLRPAGPLGCLLRGPRVFGGQHGQSLDSQTETFNKVPSRVREIQGCGKRREACRRPKPSVPL